MNIKDLENLKNEISGELSKAASSEMLSELELRYFSRKGELAMMLKGLKNLDENARKETGALANRYKEELYKQLEEARQRLVGAKKEDFVDVTLPGNQYLRGHLHPITLIQNELEDLFASMGFMVLDGPELESDYYCFEALNIPKNHPARDMQDTFYIDKKNDKEEYDLLMRTHTSPVQIRAMQKYGAPIKAVVPGRVFRSEAIDACHEHTFYQMEGLMVDKNISISNLIAVMKELINGIFNMETETRVRPGFFPFVEPGIEMDIKCKICAGKGCPSCKYSGWLELLPAGMVHPKVLEYGGIDSKQYSGFAFGLGLTRLAMMKYGIGDIRHFNSGDLRFLKQF
jgi:phenylalanyl-tRNA synthetase alpha chain